MGNPSPVIRKIQEEPQSLLALGYVALIVIGMINEACYYREFGINIFEYSEVFDFLIAPFKKFEYIFLLFISLMVAMIGFTVDRYFEKNYPKIHIKMNLGVAKKSWFTEYRIASAVIVFLFFLFFYGQISSERSKTNLIKKSVADTEVIFNSGINQRLEGNKIGANKNYLFLLDKNKTVHIIPTNGKIEQIIPILDIQ